MIRYSGGFRSRPAHISRESQRTRTELSACASRLWVNGECAHRQAARNRGPPDCRRLEGSQAAASQPRAHEMVECSCSDPNMHFSISNIFFVARLSTEALGTLIGVERGKTGLFKIGGLHVVETECAQMVDRQTPGCVCFVM